MDQHPRDRDLDHQGAAAHVNDGPTTGTTPVEEVDLEVWEYEGGHLLVPWLATHAIRKTP